MNPTPILVTGVSGAQGEAIENYVLDRVSGDVEKNLGNVLENAMDGASVPVAALLVLEAATGIRRLYTFLASQLVAGLRHATKETRQGNLEGMFTALAADTSDGNFKVLELTDPESVLKSKAWEVPGLTQTAEVTGTSGLALLDALFVPSPKTFTLAGLIAKLEDLAITEGTVMIFVNQEFPELALYTLPSSSDDEFDAGALTTDVSASAPIAVVNAQFVTVGDNNPKFGFESGAGF